jgi:hypothetical protein
MEGIAGSATRMAGRGPSEARIVGLRMEGPPGGRRGIRMEDSCVGKTTSMERSAAGGQDVEAVEPCTTRQCERLQ